MGKTGNGTDFVELLIMHYLQDCRNDKPSAPPGREPALSALGDRFSGKQARHTNGHRCLSETEAGIRDRDKGNNYLFRNPEFSP